MRAVKENNDYKVVQNGTVTHYWKNSYLPNITKVGSPTITNETVISGFSSSNYAYIPDAYVPLSTANSWEIVTKFVLTSDSAQMVFFSTNNSGSKESRIGVNNKKIRLGIGGSSDFSVLIDGTTVLSINTAYWVKAEFTGSAYKIYLSTDGETWNLEGSQNTSTKVLSDKILYIGNTTISGYNYILQGSIDLKESYFNINGVRWWSGAYSSRIEVASTAPYDYTTTEDIYKCWGSQQTIFESSTGGDYTVALEAGDYEITCVGGGGAAAMRGVYDDKGYGWGGGSGGAVRGLFTLPAGTYSVTVGSANNNATAQTSNSQTSNPSDTTTHDSSIQGVVVCGGGGSGHYNTSYVGAAGSAPVFTIQPSTVTLNTAGNAGSYNSGGKGSAAAATCAGGASVYAGYGQGQGCKTSEYASKRSWINGTSGYVRIIKVGG